MLMTTKLGDNIFSIWLPRFKLSPKPWVCHQNSRVVNKFTNIVEALQGYFNGDAQSNNESLVEHGFYGFGIMEFLNFAITSLPFFAAYYIGHFRFRDAYQSFQHRCITYPMSVSVWLGYCRAVKWVLDVRFAWLNFWNPGKTLSFHERTRVPILSNNESRISLLFYDHNRNINWYNS